MDRKKIIYIGSILLATVFVSVTYFSYAFFTSKNEYHGRVNMVVGTLDYELKSSLLENNSITLAANEKARLNIEVKSLNDINSKYELFYTTTNNNIEIGYNTTNDLPTGTINPKEKKTITVIIKNPSNSSATITFGVQGGFTHNSLVLDNGRSSISQIQSRYCEVDINTVYSFDYNGTDGTDGSEQTFTVPCSGEYKLETWGAQGQNTANFIGGYGGYSVGQNNLSKNDTLYVVVGQAGIDGTSYNGGGLGYFNGGGGGATHIATSNGELSSLSASVSSILIVSGGGGGAGQRGENYGDGNGGSAGGYIGNRGTSTNNSRTFGYGYGLGGSQDVGGAFQWIDTGSGRPSGIYDETNLWTYDSQYYSYVGDFGKGGCGIANHAGGGAGFYGGGGSAHGGAGGGSGYIGSPRLYNKAMYCYDCEESSEPSTKTISTTGTSLERDTTNCPNGYSSDPISKCAKIGNGYARITFLNESSEEEKTKINYIVNFDANGGTMNQNTKILSYGEEYGTLPTPTREGYTFKGWNGKNLFNKEFFKNSSVYIDDKIDVGWDYLSSYKFLLKSNNSYTLSLKTNNFIASNGWLYRMYYSDKISWVELQRYIQEDFSYSFMTNNDGYIYIGHLYGFGTDSNYDGIRMIYYLDKVDIQLEEGSIATPYEPYYITSDTTVTQKKNHTLKAIWEKN